VAIRLFVESVTYLRASVQTSSLRVVAPQFRAATATVSRPVLAAVAAYKDYQASVDYRQLATLIAYQEMRATGVILDPDTLNRYFRGQDPIAFIDAAALGVSKPLEDAFGSSDAVDAKDVGKALASDLEFAEYLDILLTIIRDFTDELGFVDAPSFDIDKPLEDVTFSLGDAVDTIDFVKPRSDLAVLSDATRFDHTTEKADAFSFTDAFSRVVQYDRGFADELDPLGDADIALDVTITPAADSFAWSDDSFTDFVKVSDDSFSHYDEQVIDLSRFSSDGFAVADTFVSATSYQRAFSEAITAVADTRPVLAFGLGKAEEVSVLEALSYDLSFFREDTATVSDSPALLTERPEADGISVADTFQRVVLFSRAFSDAFTLDDNATVGGVIKDSQFAKSNVLSFVEIQTFSVAKQRSDSFSVSDATALHPDKAAAESFSLADAISLSKKSEASSVLNAGALNYAPFNN